METSNGILKLWTLYRKGSHLTSNACSNQVATSSTLSTVIVIIIEYMRLDAIWSREIWFLRQFFVVLILNSKYLRFASLIPLAEKMAIEVNYIFRS